MSLVVNVGKHVESMWGACGQHVNRFNLHVLFMRIVGVRLQKSKCRDVLRTRRSHLLGLERLEP